MIIGITGHRFFQNKEFVEKTIENLLLELKPILTITGMALGVDTLFANLCIKLHIPFVAAIPFKGQENRWPDAQQQEYNRLLKLADRIQIVSDGAFSIEKMHVRNKYIVDNSDLMLGVFMGKNGGTKNCLSYALSQKKNYIIINPNTKKIIR